MDTAEHDGGDQSSVVPTVSTRRGPPDWCGPRRIASLGGKNPLREAARERLGLLGSAWGQLALRSALADTGADVTSWTAEISARTNRSRSRTTAKWSASTKCVTEPETACASAT